MRTRTLGCEKCLKTLAPKRVFRARCTNITGVDDMVSAYSGRIADLVVIQVQRCPDKPFRENMSLEYR
jgi:hypothetical protein